jgi:hypothetical protein
MTRPIWLYHEHFTPLYTYMHYFQCSILMSYIYANVCMPVSLRHISSTSTTKLMTSVWTDRQIFHIYWYVFKKPASLPSIHTVITYVLLTWSGVIPPSTGKLVLCSFSFLPPCWVDFFYSLDSFTSGGREVQPRNRCRYQFQTMDKV